MVQQRDLSQTFLCVEAREDDAIDNTLADTVVC
jgi:hypothetical protein